MLEQPTLSGEEETFQQKDLKELLLTQRAMPRSECGPCRGSATITFTFRPLAELGAKAYKATMVPSAFCTPRMR